MKNNNLIYPLATTVKPTKARQRSKSGIVISLLCWISCLALTLCATDHTYSNPILSVQKKAGADPALFFHQGIFYFYSTNEDNRVFSSTDMVNWTPGQQVLPDHLKGAWAPEPYYHAETQKFYIYYTFHYKIGVAVGDRPDAMFTDLGILCLDGIDAHPFRDDDGRLYLYFTNTPQFRMFCIPMKSPTETGGPVTKCFEISQAWERHNFPINEGPWMLKLNGVYQLMYSGSDGQSIYYSIGLATAPSPIGPFLKYQNNPIFSGLPDIYCTGHGSVEYDKSGQLWHLYHQKPDTTIGWIRDICLDKVGFDEQGLLKGTPTRGKTQPAPIMTENLVWIPSFNPRGAIFTETTTVSLACRTEGSEIYYTSDGSTPTKASTVFQKPFTLRGNTILKARAFKNGMDASSVATEIFKRCESPLVENPSPNGISIEPGFDIFPQSTLDWKKLKKDRTK